MKFCVINTLSAFKDTRWANENFIIMTDIRTQGYGMVDRLRGLDVTHAKLALEEIAKLHAATWAYKQKQGLKFICSKYPNFKDDMYDQQQMVDQFKPMMDNLGDSTAKVVEEALGADHPACQGFRDLLNPDKNTMGILREFVQAEGMNEELVEGYLRVKPKDSKDFVRGKS